VTEVGDIVFELDKAGRRSRGTMLRETDRVGQGASGTVYRYSAEPGKAIKIYELPQAKRFEAKIRTMVTVRYNRPHLSRFDFVWPEALLADSTGAFAGFKMPFLGNGWVDLDSLMQSSDAERMYGVGEKERISIASNLALAVQQLHAIHIYCVDLKPENIRVQLGTMSVGIIDCDGMSVIDVLSPNGAVRFHGDKSTPEFWAPENVGVLPSFFKDEEAHDRFALAVIIFMVLNRGIHPYQGILLSSRPSIETTAGKIHKGLYPYGGGRGKITPHRKTLYPFWTEETRGLFDRAFTTLAARPSAAEWHTHLSALAANLGSCARRPQLHATHPSVGCPICARDGVVLASPSASRGHVRKGASPAPAASGAGAAQTIARQAAVVHAMPSATAASPSPAWTRPIPAGRVPPKPRLSSPSHYRALVALAIFAAPVLGLIGLSGNFGAITSQPTQPPPSPCTQEARFEEARKGGAAALRIFIRECHSSGSANLSRANSALEAVLFQESMACINSSCNMDMCLARYTNEFPNGSQLASLSNAANQGRSSTRCRPSSCTDVQLAEAERWGASELRVFIRKCQSEGGVNVTRAKAALETALYQSAMQCIRSNCTFDPCIAIYTSEFPYGSFAQSLRTTATQTSTSQRCRPSAPPSAYVAPSNRHWCPHPGASMGWWCHTSQRCGPAGGCIGQEPRPSGRSSYTVGPAPVGVPSR
jgi:serine/threonine protein kinase